MRRPVSSPLPFARLAQWLRLGCVLVTLLSGRAAWAYAPMCDWTASSVNAPLPAPPSEDGEIAPCDVERDVQAFTTRAPGTPERSPIQVLASGPRELAVMREVFGATPAEEYSVLLPLPPPPEVVGSSRAEHRAALERPPRG